MFHQNLLHLYIGLSASASDSTEVSSTHSSPLLRHNSRDMPLTTSHPGNVTHCFSGVSHVMFLARSVIQRVRSSRISRRLQFKKKHDERLFPNVCRLPVMISVYNFHNSKILHLLEICFIFFWLTLFFSHLYIYYSELLVNI